MLANTSLQRLALPALLVAIIIWASSFVVMKIAVAEFGPILTVFLRMILASAVLFFFIPVFKKEPYQAGDWKWFLGLALCEPCLYFVFEGLALTYTTASEAGMITALQPLMVAIAAFYFLNEKVHRRLFIGSAIAVVGAGLLSFNGQATETSPNPLLGNFLEVCAIAFAAAYSIIARRLANRYSALFLTGIQTFVGSVFFLPLVAFAGEPVPASITWDGAFAILFLAWGVNIIAFTCYNFALSKMEASQAGAWLNLLPLACLFFGWLLLNETLTQVQYFGALIIIVGVVVSQKKPRQKTVFIEQELVTEHSERDHSLVCEKSSSNLPGLVER
ncbi:DMT family transporter [Pleionea sp. CnH1-48]|uniref:DMT family transporter n=1 Tax=Pleionea sp. CnH1-48 TaxID=2954494 RepID=UPI00209691B9|nr:DMT family transporter [Pleionea sp. CnH1-48]MCO7224656.1 DMT family transporter [Pleionea sp. CnH1-48]